MFFRLLKLLQNSRNRLPTGGRLESNVGKCNKFCSMHVTLHFRYFCLPFFNKKDLTFKALRRKFYMQSYANAASKATEISAGKIRHFPTQTVISISNPFIRCYTL